MSRGDHFLGCSQDVFHRNESEEEEFCTQENWQTAVIHISQELQFLGYPSIQPSDGNLDLVSWVNTTWKLLRNYRSTLKTISDLESQSRRLASEMTSLDETSNRQKEVIEYKERQLIDSEETHRRTDECLQSTQLQLKAEKDENRRLSGLLTYRENQYQHESKRKDVEISKLKERIMKLLVEKSGHGGSKMGSGSVTLIPAIEMSYLYTKPEGMSRTKWRIESADQTKEESLLSRVTQDLQDKLHRICLENDQLRDHLFNLQTDLLKCLRNREELLNDCDSDLDNSPAYKLPMIFSWEKIDKRSKNICQGLLRLFDELDKKLSNFETGWKLDSTGTDSVAKLKRDLALANNDIEKLKRKLDAARSALEKSEVRKRNILEDNFVLESVRPAVDHPRAPAWTLNRPHVTVNSRAGKVSESLPGVTVVPVYNYNRVQLTPTRKDAHLASRRSLSRSRDSGSGSDTAKGVIKRRMHLPVRSSPPLSGGETPRGQSRPKSVNLSVLKSSKIASRTASLSPTSTLSSDTISRSLPRQSQGRRLYLHRHSSGNQTSDSETSVTKPPRNFSVTLRQSSIRTGLTAATSDDSSPSFKPQQGVNSEQNSGDELSAKLEMLGQFLEQKQLLATSGGAETDDSEMFFHLENVQKALKSNKK